MDKERLEEVKSNWDYSCESGGYPEPDDVEWLISTVEEQAKKIEYYKNLHGKRSVQLERKNIEYRHLEQKNKKMRIALTDIKDIMSRHSPIHNIAKSALEESE